MFRVTPLAGNSQKLDGGAMFGNAPKAMWERWVHVDASNRIDLACRCFLLQEEDGLKRNILLETGVGAFFEPRLRERYGIVETEHVLLNSLSKVGLTDQDIHLVILSHLHFDHAGGLLSQWQLDSEPELLFPNATYVTSRRAWERAQNPHPRDRASFLPHLNGLLESSKRLHLIDDTSDSICGPGLRFHYVDGHTPGMVLTEIVDPAHPFIFAGDLVPGQAWVHIPITMGYDRYPELVIDEKMHLLRDLSQRGGGFLFTHDPDIAAAQLIRDERDKMSGVPVDITSMIWKGDDS